MKAEVRHYEQESVEVAASSLPAPVVTYIGPGNVWRLGEAYEYRDGDNLITVPEGFRFDLASIPRVFWFLVSPFELSIAAPLLHDFLYDSNGNPPDGAIDPPRVYTRKEADQLFRTIMEIEGVPALASQPGIRSGTCLRLDRLAEGIGVQPKRGVEGLLSESGLRPALMPCSELGRFGRWTYKPAPAASVVGRCRRRSLRLAIHCLASQNSIASSATASRCHFQSRKVAVALSAKPMSNTTGGPNRSSSMASCTVSIGPLVPPSVSQGRPQFSRSMEIWSAYQ